MTSSQVGRQGRAEVLCDPMSLPRPSQGSPLASARLLPGAAPDLPNQSALPPHCGPANHLGPVSHTLTLLRVVSLTPVSHTGL